MTRSQSMLDFRYHILRGVALMWILTVCWSCMQDQTSTRQSLSGTWVLSSAERNNRPTNSLEGLYMAISDETSMQTNLLGDTMTMEMTLDGSTLRLMSQPPHVLDVTNRTDSTLSLALEVKGQRILMNLQRL